MIGSTLVERSVADLVAAGLDGTEADLLVVNPARDTIRELVAALGSLPSPPRVRLLADEAPVKDLMDDFLVASEAADLVAAEVLAIRTVSDPPRNSLLVSENAVVSVVDGGEAVAGLPTTDAEFVRTTVEHYRDRWAGAAAFSLRTPPISEVRETLAADIGEGVAADFDAVLDALGTARGDGDGLDEVTISILVAARNGELLYDISKWGEDVGLASKATFSRTKTRLEDRGLVDTEKVPIDVGRPRLRLMLGDERLETAEADDLARVARSLLSA